jgi:excisionase family DNA binding protein
MTPLLSLRDAARLLGISFWSVRRLIKTGRLTPVQVGRRVLLEQSAIEQFISAHRRTNHGSELI